MQLTYIFDQREQQTTPTCDRVGRFWGWLGFCLFQKGFPHARTQFSGRRVGVPTPTFYALAASLVIEKFPLQLRQVLILLAKKEVPSVPHPATWIWLAMRRLEITFSTTYTLESNSSDGAAAVDHFWLHLLPPKWEIQRAKASDGTAATRFVTPTVMVSGLQVTRCPNNLFYDHICTESCLALLLPPFHTTCTTHFSSRRHILL